MLVVKDADKFYGALELHFLLYVSKPLLFKTDKKLFLFHFFLLIVSRHAIFLVCNFYLILNRINILKTSYMRYIFLKMLTTMPFINQLIYKVFHLKNIFFCLYVKNDIDFQ